MADAVVPWAVPIAPPQRIEVADLVLDRWTQNDLEPLFVAITESIEHLRPWMPWASQHQRSTVVEFLAASEAGGERGDRFEYAIRDRQGEVLGSAGLMGRIGVGGLEIGYWVHVAHVRRGIATRAAAALSDAALGLSSVDRVQIHHDEANIASGAVPARLGFRKLGVFPEEPKAPADTGREVIWRLQVDR